MRGQTARVDWATLLPSFFLLMCATTAQFVWRLYASLEVVTVHGVPHVILNSDGVLRMIAVLVPLPDEDPRGAFADYAAAGRRIG